MVLLSPAADYRHTHLIGHCGHIPRPDEALLPWRPGNKSGKPSGYAAISLFHALAATRSCAAVRAALVPYQIRFARPTMRRGGGIADTGRSAVARCDAEPATAGTM
jgi:hypothetical protein